MITTLTEHITALPEQSGQLARRLFRWEIAAGSAEPPAAMIPWVEAHFGSVAAVRDQTIVRVTNRLTLEEAIFNPLRARRPHLSAASDSTLNAQIALQLQSSDQFRDPLHATTADSWGRIRGRHCITASNVAKYAQCHGLVIFDEPHPLRWDREQLHDYLAVAFEWLTRAQAATPEAIYPLITWNCLPTSGATQMHGHMQIALTGQYQYARIELWRRAASSYQASYQRGYL